MDIPNKKIPTFLVFLQNELIHPEGTDCADKITKTIGHVNSLYAR
jgi:hypothetical protein